MREREPKRSGNSERTRERGGDVLLARKKGKWPIKENYANIKFLQWDPEAGGWGGWGLITPTPYVPMQVCW